MLQSLAIPAVPKTPHLIFSIFFLLGISILLFSAIFDSFSFFRAAHKPMLFSEFHEKHSSQYSFHLPANILRCGNVLHTDGSEWTFRPAMY